MIDHVSIGVRDLERSKNFYDRVLSTLGYSRLMDVPDACGYGLDRPMFWIGKISEDLQERLWGSHLAFVAPSRAAVDNFYNMAIEFGACDEGQPGTRPLYHPDYYGAFVFDLDGHKIEACIRRPV